MHWSRVAGSEKSVKVQAQLHHFAHVKLLLAAACYTSTAFNYHFQRILCSVVRVQTKRVLVACDKYIMSSRRVPLGAMLSAFISLPLAAHCARLERRAIVVRKR